jgi:hypothetical protein
MSGPQQATGRQIEGTRRKGRGKPSNIVLSETHKAHRTSPIPDHMRRCDTVQKVFGGCFPFALAASSVVVV